MKYIRTKEYGICKVTNEDKHTISYKNSYVCGCLWKDNYKNEIQYADTIEELCDEFVFIDEFFKREHRLSYSLENALALCKYHDVDITTLRSAIWTDKGLIYVAKMNEKGELELL